jgi:serine/threonine protein kinase
MTYPSKVIDSQMVYLDPYLVDRERLQFGFSLKELAHQADVHYRTLRDIMNKEGVLPSKARDIAQTLKQDVLKLLAPWDPRYVVPSQSAGPLSGASEWESTGYLEQGRLAPNGLYYIVCRMQHRHTAGKLGRGKFYHLSRLPSAQRNEMTHRLSRHADVCACVGVHPHIVVNHTSTPVANDEGWWVIDEWVGETTLADHIEKEPWPLEKLPRLLHEIALGLEVLHQKKIVFRELAPARVLIADKGNRAVLTDFELAKLLDGSPSVSSEWPEDPFRAPEVEGGTVTEGADLYSLAMVASAAIAGPGFDPESVPPIETLKASNLPKRVLRLLMDSLGPLNRRSPELTPVLKELARWAEG